MGGNVGELSQLDVGAIQFIDFDEKVRFGSFAGREIADGCSDENSVGAVKRTEHQLNREASSVFAQCCKFDSGANLLFESVFRGAETIGKDALRETLRDNVG